MDQDNMRFDEDATVVNFDDVLDFQEFVDEVSDVQIELLAARVKAARFAGA